MKGAVGLITHKSTETDGRILNRETTVSVEVVSEKRLGYYWTLKGLSFIKRFKFLKLLHNLRAFSSLDPPLRFQVEMSETWTTSMRRQMSLVQLAQMHIPAHGIQAMSWNVVEVTNISPHGDDVELIRVFLNKHALSGGMCTVVHKEIKKRFA